MAEAWAKEWIRKRKENLHSKLLSYDERNRENNLLQYEFNRENIEKSISALDNFVVVSIALDCAAVYEETVSYSDLFQIPAGFHKHHYKRKSIKEKAINAMAKDGIDISQSFPKAFQEVMPELEANFPVEILSSSLSSLSRIGEDEKDDVRPVDKLVVLCSCGDDMKKNLANQSKSVEEWNIDAPTAAAKSGEGDDAYHRVSLEIRDEVDNLMSRLVE
eukprot:CAMPEP_0184865340 /NCGR_PEP_ID=MMETSP0580-20130426/17758_1 /TAXON_ID=1118495 /ORGANISM="Dactyliosolen fragilissimus" /LENGTH=217 /DNA_ID=CAMNT_0027364497 /DNA_START=38 /DNA_END=691 /DNA_ORIENTATION=-